MNNPINFLNPTLLYRQQKTSLKKEGVARALGLKKGTNPFIIDATAGFANDSFILASLGFQVTLLERSPEIYQWIKDAMRRAEDAPNIKPIIDRMHLIYANGIEWLGMLSDKERPEKIYLDPMFPERKKTALPKKELLLLQKIVGSDDDADALLRIALHRARDRVVVKRPRLASPLLSDRSPSFIVEGSSSRFDVYLTSKK